MIRRATGPAAAAAAPATAREPAGGAIGLSGLIDGDVAALFCETLAALQPNDAPVELALEHARVDDPRIARAVADAIRQTTLRLGQVHITGAPTALRQALADAARDEAIALE